MDVVIRILRYIKRALGPGVLYETEVSPKLLNIVMRIGQVHLQIEAPLLGIVYLMAKT